MAKSSSELARTYSLTKTESDELENLIAEVDAKGFTLSSELSNYITRHKLGNTYPNISGLVKMQDGLDSWNFNGGFPSSIYRIVCKELLLKGKDTTARVVGFKSYKDINQK